MVNQEQVLDALRVVIDPDLHRDIVSLGFIQELKVHDNRVSFHVQLTTPACPVKDELRQQAEDAVRSLPDVEAVEVTMTAQVRSHGPVGQAMLPGVKNVIPVGSGKGASANRPSRPIWRSLSRKPARKSGSWTPTFTVPASPRFWESPSGRNQADGACCR